MTTQWDRSVDLVIAGSGGGGMVAGLAALDCGLEPLIVEKQALIGGSTGLSGGIVWLPNNPLMRAEGVADSHEDGLAYLADVVGDIGAPSSPERREMFLTAGYEMIDFLIRKGVRLVRCAGWSDYYPNHKGGNAAGRAVEGIPYNAAKFGQLERQGPAAAGQGLRICGVDQRVALGAVLQPCAKGFRRGYPGVPAQYYGPDRAAADSHQRFLADCTNAQADDRSPRR
jgi:FAD binding domain